MKRTLKRILIPFCLLVLIGLLLYSYRLAILHSALRAFSEQTGVEIVELDVDSLGLKRVVINSLKLRQVTAKQKRETELSGLTLVYDLETLLDRQHLDSIELSRGSVSLTLYETDESPTNSETDNAQFELPGAVLLKLPFRELKIGALSININPATSDPRKFELTGEMNVSAEAATIVASLAEVDKGQVRLNGELKNDGRISLDLRDTTTAGTPVIAVTSKIVGENVGEVRTDGDFAIEIGDSLALIEPWLATLTLPFALDGRLSGTWQSTFRPKTKEWEIAALRAQVELDPINTADFTINSEAFDIEIPKASGKDQTWALEARLGPVNLSGNYKKFEIKSLELSGQTKLRWDRDKGRLSETAGTSIRVKDFYGRYNEIHFLNADASAALATLTPWKLKKPIALQIEEINVGLPIKKISGSINVLRNRRGAISSIRITDASARVLGGKVASKRLDYKLGQAKQSLMLSIDDVDLSEVLALQQQEELSGSGRLDGELPILIDGSGVSVDSGLISAREPGGVIRYVPEKSAADLGAKELEIVLDALRNYHYQALEMGVHYAPDGTLRLKAKLAGKNPDLNQGQAINFNINIEENIPALLKSLQLTSSIQETIAKQLQKGYESKR